MTEGIPLTRDILRALQEAGYVVVPLQPTEDMLRAGAPFCFQAYDGAWDTALRDAAKAYRAMIAIIES